MRDSEKLKLLLDAYVAMNRIAAEPGDRSHALWFSINRLWNLLKELSRKRELTGIAG